MNSNGKQSQPSKRDGRLKTQIENDFQNTAIEEVLAVFEDKRLVKVISYSTDRIEAVKTIFNRARDLERESKRVTLARAEPDMSQYDPLNKLWKACGFCGAVDITHESGSDSKEYQACFTCRYFLNDDGTTTRMKR